jgi:hypothetical protein
MKRLFLVFFVFINIGCSFIVRVFLGDNRPPDNIGGGSCLKIPGVNSTFTDQDFFSIPPLAEVVCSSEFGFPCNCPDTDTLDPTNLNPTEFPNGTINERVTPFKESTGSRVNTCKASVSYAWPDCASLAEVSGLVSVGGQNLLDGNHGRDNPIEDALHCKDRGDLDTCDDDFALSICPDVGSMRINAFNNPFPLTQDPLIENNEIRTMGTWDHGIGNTRGRIHLEVQGCRYFNGFWTITDSELPQPFVLPSRPQGRQTDLVSAAGDWAVDDPLAEGPPDDHTGYVELHEARIYATTKPPPPEANPTNLPITYSMVSGFFTTKTDQQDELLLDIKVPKSPFALNKSQLECTLLPTETSASSPNAASNEPLEFRGSSPHCTTPPTPNNPNPQFFTNGAELDEPIAVPDAIIEPDGSVNAVCRVHVTNVDHNSGAEHEFNCQAQCDGRDFGVCPDNDILCFSTPSQDLLEQDCNNIATAFVVRARWIDPLDTWSCQCPCDDPSAPGATITAPIQGCASVDTSLSSPEQQQSACEQVCGGVFCGLDAPDCKVNECSPPVSGGSARLVSKGTCDPESTSAIPLRVSETGDYHVTLSPPNSFFRVERHRIFNVTLFEDNINDGEFFLNAKDGIVDFSKVAVTLKPISVLRHDVTQGILINVQRLIGTIAGDSFQIEPDLGKFGFSGIVDDEPQHTIFSNPVDFTGTFNPSTHFFSLDFTVGEGGEEDEEDGGGEDEGALELVVHLEGTIDNGPPSADASNTPSVVECSDHNNTPVLLDGTTSSDPDNGDSISHYQWFDDLSAGVGNEATEMVILPVGDFNFELHVYDEKLGATQTNVPVTVQDTIPPELSVSPQELCLWPPNHKRFVFHLDQEVTAASEDICDASPAIRIVNVTSDEPDNGQGDGDTAGDVAFSDDAFCVRRERSGTGDGRVYTITVEAKDFSGNTTQKQVQVRVPHNHELGCNDNGQSIAEDAPCQ